jgi:hypothetical protein
MNRKSQTKANRNEIPLTKIKLILGMEKFRDKNGKLREKIQWVEEDIPNFPVNCTVREDETESGK